jgi:hypothetical protein
MEAPAGGLGTIMPGNIAQRKPVEQLQAEVRTPLCGPYQSTISTDPTS